MNRSCFNDICGISLLALLHLEESRLKRARQELETALRYSDEDFLKESLELAKTAGIDEESIEKATRQLARLRMVDEVSKMLVGALG